MPLTLYYSEGKTQAEIGRILGVTDRAAAHRLQQGLKLLRNRLARRGIAVAAGTLVALIGGVPFVNAIPTRLMTHTTEVALAIAAGGPANTTAAQLALDVTRATAWSKLKVVAILLFPAMGLLAGGILFAQRSSQAAPEASLPPTFVVAPSSTEAKPTDYFGDPLPAGAVTRMGTVRFRTGKPGGISSVAFGPGGKVLVSAHGKNVLSFWDAETGREVRKLDAPAMCWSVSTPPDGNDWSRRDLLRCGPGISRAICRNASGKRSKESRSEYC